MAARRRPRRLPEPACARTPRSERRHAARRGFTLVEIGDRHRHHRRHRRGMVGRVHRAAGAGLPRRPRRAPRLVDQADLALRRIGRDLRIALPNSVRVTGYGPARWNSSPRSSGARYATAGSGRARSSACPTASLRRRSDRRSTLGGAASNSSSTTSVHGRRRLGRLRAQRHAPPSRPRRTAAPATNAAGAATHRHPQLAGALAGGRLRAALPRASRSTSPVSYRCDLGSGLLTRHQGYGFVASQPDPPAGGTSAVLASGVTACRFSADGHAGHARARPSSTCTSRSATTTSAGSESVTLHHAVYVDNLP
ncbi:MAG: hypothetical protein MZW92_58000 [Comamonadaceae bacterium]|nr:hypothetical protein [Comamonadaceae bacterium]